MSTFQAEYPIFVFTLIASATIEAGEPVTAAGAKALTPKSTVGIAMSDAVSGEAMPVMGLGIGAVKVYGSSAGVAVGDRVAWLTNGYEVVPGSGGIGIALDAGAADATIRVFFCGARFSAAAALTAVDASTVDGTYGAQEAAVLGNVRTRVGEIEAALVAAGILTAAA